MTFTMKAPLFLLPFLATLLLVSCSDEPTAPQAAQGPILPLAIGNKWVGETMKFNSDGTLLSTRTDITGIFADTLLSGEKWYLLDNEVLTTNRSDGLYEWRDSRGVATIALKHPATVGQATELATPIGMGTITLVAVGEQLTVRGKSYRCSHYVLKFEGHASEMHLYLEPGKGWVKKETKFARSVSDPSLYTGELWEVTEIVLH